MLVKKHPEVKGAVNCAQRISWGERLRYAMLLRQKQKMDEAAREDFVREEGLAEGLMKGREQGLVEGLMKGREDGGKETLLAMARKMKALGEPTEKIRAITGLSPELIEKL